ncbi:MAG: hypothetical protein U0R51_07645 [Solirubrobacterales bacterium]
MVVAVVALVAALGGAAYAGSKIGSDDLDNGAVTAKKLAKGAVTKKAIAKDAVTGKAVKESSLKTVPSAATAGGLTPASFSARVAPPAALAKVKTVGTLEIRFGCDASSGPQVTVVPAPGAPPQTTRVSTVTGLDSDTLQGGGQGTLPAGGIVVLDGNEAGVSFNGTINSLTQDGAVTTINWAARSTATFPSANPDENNCLFWGTSLAG